MAAKKKQTQAKTQEATTTEQTTTEQQPEKTTEAETEAETQEETTTETEGEQTTSSGDETDTTTSEPTSEPKKTTETKTTETSGTTKPELVTMEASIDAYMQAMEPQVPQSTEDLIRNQMKLKSIVDNLLRRDDTIFDEAMKLLVKKVRAGRDGVFSDRYVFRAFPQLRISRAERQRLESLMSLILTTADAKQKSQVAKQVDLDQVIRHVQDNDQQQKLRAYYGD